MKKFALSKKKRLVSNRQFREILSRGRCVRNDLLILYIAENKYDYPRVGVSVGKVHGNAVVRNRLKRLLREVFRQCQDRIPTGFDYLIMISRSKKTTKLLTFEQMEKAFLTLINSLLDNKFQVNNNNT